MRPFSRADLRSLMEAPEGVKISIFMPTEKAGRESLQNAIRFKNLVRQAEERVQEGKRMRPGDSREFFRKAQQLQDETIFWQHQSEGLSVFIAEGMTRHFRVPIRFDELAIVDDRFYVKPLLRLLTGDGRFYVLAVSRRRMRLFESTRFEISEINLGDLPARNAELVGKAGGQTRQQLQANATAGAAGRPATFHGQAGADDETKPETRRFFQAFDRGLREILRDKEAPMVLAGVEYLLPIYREASSYPQIVEEEVHGNAAEMRLDELRERGWAVMEPVFAREHLVAASRFQRLAGTGRASDQIREIVPATSDGRVEVLFLKKGARAWGRFDRDLRGIRIDDEHIEGNQDLLDLAAVQAVMHGGKVYVVDGELMPVEEAPIAAVFRY